MSDSIEELELKIRRLAEESEAASRQLEQRKTNSSTQESDLQKAHYAAAIFAKYSFQGHSGWYVQESITNYTKHGEELKEKSGIRQFQNRIWYKVVSSSHIKDFDPSLAYLVAKSLEREEKM